MKRDTQLRDLFDQVATHPADGSPSFLTQEQFASLITSASLPPLADSHAHLLFQIADRSRSGGVSWGEFMAFSSLLSKPDAEYEIAFRVFDTNQSGEISYDDFKRILTASIDPNVPPFDFDCSWLSLYLGPEQHRHAVRYKEFSQLIKGFQGERLRQAFLHYDKDRTGYITAQQFRDVVLRTARHKMSDYIVERLPAIVELSDGARVSYAMCRAFLNVATQLDTVESVVRQAVDESGDKEQRITKEEFQRVAARQSRFRPLFSPLEVDIIFHFAGLQQGADGASTGRFSLEDFARMMQAGWKRPSAASLDAEEEQPIVAKGKVASFGMGALHQVYNFALGSIAGAVGATAVYPIDLVKTRMQNQRSAKVGELLYRNSFDCFKKVVRNEGLVGLYRGLGPQLVGVAPEKAIKLTMNDLVRGFFNKKQNGEIRLWQEVLAGCVAGGSQVIFTNPLEIVKIRLQVQGELLRNLDGPPVAKRGAMHIVRELGLLGLYKGASACLLRDIPFSGIYFSVYAHMKKDVFHEGREGKKLSITELLSAGALAGIPAAYLVTPADVIKTRLQVAARKGQTSYNGIMDAFGKIYKEEGFRAFFKGGPARVLRSSPQFGVTLMVYEILQGAVPFDSLFSRGKISKSDEPHETAADGFRMRTRHGLKMLMEMDYQFGMHGKHT